MSVLEELEQHMKTMDQGEQVADDGSVIQAEDSVKLKSKKEARKRVVGEVSNKTASQRSTTKKIMNSDKKDPGLVYNQENEGVSEQNEEELEAAALQKM